MSEDQAKASNFLRMFMDVKYYLSYGYIERFIITNVNTQFVSYYQIILHYIILHYIISHCITSYYIEPHWIALYYIISHYITWAKGILREAPSLIFTLNSFPIIRLYCIYIAVHYYHNALHQFITHYITLHYIVLYYLSYRDIQGAVIFDIYTQFISRQFSTIPIPDNLGFRETLCRTEHLCKSSLYHIPLEWSVSGDIKVYRPLGWVYNIQVKITV